MCAEGIENYTESDCKCAGLALQSGVFFGNGERVDARSIWEDVTKWIEELYSYGYWCRRGHAICRYNAVSMPTCVRNSSRNNIKCYCTILTDYLLRNCWITRKAPQSLTRKALRKEYRAGDWVKKFVTPDLLNAENLIKSSHAHFIDTDALIKERSD